MTDNEIIKALKCCSETTGSECSECPLLNVECSAYDLYKLALDLINRQKAEIERLHIEGLQINKTFMDFVNKQIAEAIKEFAKRLKGKLQWDVEFDNKLVFENDIDNITKEEAEKALNKINHNSLCETETYIGG